MCRVPKPVVRVAVLAAASAGAFVGTVFAEERSPRSAPTAQSALPAAHSYSSALGRDFSIFSGRRSRSATRARGLGQRLLQEQAPGKLDPVAAVAVASSLAGSVTVVPGETGVCLSDYGASSCSSVSSADAGKAWLLAAPAGQPMSQHTLIGLAPDGVTNAEVHWTTGGTTDVSVVNNIYTVSLGGHSGWTSVSLSGSRKLQADGVAGLPQS